MSYIDVLQMTTSIAKMTYSYWKLESQILLALLQDCICCTSQTTVHINIHNPKQEVRMVPLVLDALEIERK